MLDRNNFLKIEHLNAQSLQGNLEEIKQLMNERDVDILCVSETWLSPCTPLLFGTNLSTSYNGRPQLFTSSCFT